MTGIEGLEAVTLVCPVCASAFRSWHAGEPGTVRAVRTDFRTEHARVGEGEAGAGEAAAAGGREAGAEEGPRIGARVVVDGVRYGLAAFTVHRCGRCGYVADGDGYRTDVRVRHAVHAALALAREERGCGAAGEGTLSEGTLSERHGRAAQLLEWNGGRAAAVARRYRIAAWCAEDEGDVEGERYFQRLAAWRLEAALRDPRGVSGRERARLTFLVGELWRRIGDVRRARRWFAHVRFEVVAPAEQAWLFVLAATQGSGEAVEWIPLRRGTGRVPEGATGGD